MTGLDVADVVQVTWLTLRIALAAVAVGAFIGVPLGAWLAARPRPSATALAHTLLMALYALPPVVAGLVTYLLLSRAGPLGALGLLFTPTAIVIAESLMAVPLVAGLTMAAMLEVPPEVREAVRAQVGSISWEARVLAREARWGIAGALAVAFGRALAEVAAALLAGGNIQGHTRTLGTAILQEVTQGDHAEALLLAAVLLTLALLTMLAIARLRRLDVEGIA